MYKLQENSPLYSHLGNQAIGGSIAFNPVISTCVFQGCQVEWNL